MFGVWGRGVWFVMLCAICLCIVPAYRYKHRCEQKVALLVNLSNLLVKNV